MDRDGREGNSVVEMGVEKWKIRVYGRRDGVVCSRASGRKKTGGGNSVANVCQGRKASRGRESSNTGANLSTQNL